MEKQKSVAETFGQMLDECMRAEDIEQMEEDIQNPSGGIARGSTENVKRDDFGDMRPCGSSTFYDTVSTYFK